MAEVIDIHGEQPDRAASPSDPPPRKRGRPRATIDWALFDALCAAQCTRDEIAGRFNISPTTLLRVIEREHKCTFETYAVEKREAGKGRLRSKQFELALKGDKTMLIWLGKQYLGQVERQEFTGKDGGPIATAEAPWDLTKLSNEELDQLRRLHSRAAAAGGSGAGE